MNTIPNSFEEACAAYTNTAEGNDAAHALFTAAVRADPVLHEHRTHIETHQLGFGDPAFHYLWKLLVAHSGRHPSPHFLEIGVFKGQVLSLWALLAGQLQVRASLHAISPLRGSPLPGPWTTRILRWFSPRFRDRFQNADFYDEDDYEAAVRGLFSRYGLDWEQVHLMRGLSHEPAVRSTASRHTYHLIYIDGDHTYRGAGADFGFYGGLLAPGGLLVADDAGVSLPGNGFWKGHPGVSRAADEVLPSLGLVNVLNIGHNRVFQKPA